jgi:hypothetical protein
MADLPDWLLALLGGQQNNLNAQGPSPSGGLLAGAMPPPMGGLLTAPRPVPVDAGMDSAADPNTPIRVASQGLTQGRSVATGGTDVPDTAPTSGTNVIGTPASGTTEASSPGFLSKAGTVLGSLYGQGGPGDALISLGAGIASPEGWAKGVQESLKSQSGAALNNAKLQAFKLQVQQLQQQQNATYNYFKSKGLSDADAQAAILNPDLQKTLFQKFNPTEQFSQFTDKDGTTWQINSQTGARTKLDEAQRPQLVDVPQGDGTVRKQWVTPGSAAPVAGAPAPSGSAEGSDGGAVGAPYDPKDTTSEYTSGLTKAVGATHAGLAGGVEAAQGRARDIAAMQGALERIQANGGTTGIGSEEKAKLQSAINTGWNTLGLSGQPFSVDDAQLLSKFNRQLAGGQAKDVAGARVTNFEMNNFLQSNAGLALDPNANKRLLGIQSQIEDRNINVGNGIRDMTAEALDKGKRVSPADVERYIRGYDANHHIIDPITGQDLTKNIKLGDLPTTEKGQPIAGTGPNKRMKWSPVTGDITE